MGKYGTPLYCAAWPAGEHLYVAGGGGKKSSKPGPHTDWVEDQQAKQALQVTVTCTEHMRAAWGLVLLKRLCRSLNAAFAMHLRGLLAFDTPIPSFQLDGTPRLNRRPSFSPLLNLANSSLIVQTHCYIQCELVSACTPSIGV